LTEQVYGPDSLDMAMPVNGLGDAHLTLGHVAAAQARFEQALRLVQGRNPFWEVASLRGLSQAAYLRGDAATAARRGRQAYAEWESSGSPAQLTEGLLTDLADALVAMGEAAEAQALCARVLAGQEEGGGIDPARTYDVDGLRCRGEALLALGKPSESVLFLERSVALERRSTGYDLARSRFALARALVAARGDRVRARVLAAQARDDLARFPELAWLREEVERWSRSHA
jgi:tetratricopeptide (TPR) repeat protein